MTCLDENSALDFLSGRLGPTALSEAERHLGTCAPCVELLARSAPFFPPHPVDGEGGGHAPDVPSSLATLAMPARKGRLSRTMESGPSLGGGAADGSGPGEPAATLLPGTVLKDTYTVLDLIGRGGMGEVYEVRHARLAGRYALKLLPPAFAHDNVSLTRFRREADILSALRHPHIVQVIDFDHTPAGQPFLVMEFLDGGDLAQLMATVGAMPLARVLKIVEQIVAALAAVHRRGIVHRDLKPQNVLLVRDEDLEPDRVKLVDFGLSKRSEADFRDLSGNISRDQTLLGTPRYMAPEQAAGRIDEIDASTDQFALAAMVYEMLTGSSAFDGDHMAMLLYRIVSEDPTPMRRHVPDLPEHVEAAVRRAMAKQRAERFPAVTDFLDALLGRPATGAVERSGDSARGLVLPPASSSAAAGATGPGARRKALALGLGLAAAAALVIGWRVSRGPSPPPTASQSAPVVPERPVAEAPPPPAARTPITTGATVVPAAAQAEAPAASPPGDLPPRVALVEPDEAERPEERKHPHAASAPRARAKAAGRALRPAHHGEEAAAPQPSTPPAPATPPPAEVKPAQPFGRLVEQL